MDGTIEELSEPFSSYGKAVRNALLRGFSARKDRYLVSTAVSTQFFPPTKRRTLQRVMARAAGGKVGQ